jgi:hypothetical protein
LVFLGARAISEFLSKVHIALRASLAAHPMVTTKFRLDVAVTIQKNHSNAVFPTLMSKVSFDNAKYILDRALTFSEENQYPKTLLSLTLKLCPVSNLTLPLLSCIFCVFSKAEKKLFLLTPLPS